MKGLRLVIVTALSAVFMSNALVAQDFREQRRTMSQELLGNLIDFGGQLPISQNNGNNQIGMAISEMARNAALEASLVSNPEPLDSSDNETSSEDPEPVSPTD